MLRHPSASVAAAIAVVDIDPPAGLDAETLVVWRELAPFAVQAGTLLPSSVVRFIVLCEAVREHRTLAQRRDTGPDRGRMMAEIVRGTKDFAIAPLGKPMAAAVPEAPVSKLDRFTKKARA